MPDTSGPLSLAKYSSSTLPRPTLPGTGQTMPVQEEGKRPRVPRANGGFFG
jgi:phospholipase C